MEQHPFAALPGLPAVAALAKPFAWPQSGLEPLPWFSFTVAASPGHTAAAGRIARRAEGAYRYMRRLLDVTPRFRLLVLGAGDWTRHAEAPVYGTPHMTAGGHLIVGSEPADAWHGFSRYLAVNLRSATLRALLKAHGRDDATGGPDLRGFTETLVVRGLARLVADQAGAAFPRRWVADAFATYALVAGLGETDPSGLHLVGTLVEAVRELDNGLPTLEAFNDDASGISFASAVLGDLSLARTVYPVYASEQGEPLSRLLSYFRSSAQAPTTARLADSDLARMLGRDVHPAFARIPDAFSPGRAAFGRAA